jgi:hypothetical protein
MNSNQPPALTVWYGSMPETNGKSNFTAILHRKGECISTGITVARSEYPDRVRYEADRMRHLIGELQEDPCILSYDANKHSGYVPPTPVQPVSQRYKLPDGFIAVPRALTAENGAKAALIGEFNLEYNLVCHECFGEGCNDCSGEGRWTNSIPVDWTTIKEIWARGIEHFESASPEPE